MVENEPGASEVGVCATHEGAPSTGSCERCGNFVCPLCLDDFSPLLFHCEACRDREGDGLIAFEQPEGGLFSRWWLTTRHMVFSSHDTLRRTRVGSPLKAFGYVSMTGALLGSLGSLMGVCALWLLGSVGGFDFTGPEADIMAGMLVVMLLGYPILAPLMMMLSVLFRGLLFHLAVLMMGGEGGGAAASLWSAAYLHAITVTYVPLAILQRIPGIGAFIGLFGYLGIEVYFALGLTVVAERHHGLEGGRATFAGWFPFLVIAGLLGSCCLLGVLAVLGPR